MTRAARIYDFALAGNAARELLVEGSYYRILSSTGALEIRRDGGSALGPIYAGQGERAQFQRLTLVDKSGAANTGLVIVADDTFIDDRITGEVSVIDGGKSRTLADIAHMAYLACPAVGGQYAHVQIWNSGSTRCVLESFSFSSDVVVTVNVQLHAALIGADCVAQSRPQSKLLGGNSYSTIFNRFANSAAFIPTGTYRGVYRAPANTTVQYNLREPIVIPANFGLVFFVGNAVNTNLEVNAEVYAD